MLVEVWLMLVDLHVGWLFLVGCLLGWLVGWQHGTASLTRQVAIGQAVVRQENAPLIRSHAGHSQVPSF